MFWCPKEPSHRDGSFEYPQHMFWLRNKKNNFLLHTLNWGPGLHCSNYFPLNFISKIQITIFNLITTQSPISAYMVIFVLFILPVFSLVLPFHNQYGFILSMKKQCGSRSASFIRSQLIWIYIVFYKRSRGLDFIKLP